MLCSLYIYVVFLFESAKAQDKAFDTVNVNITTVDTSQPHRRDKKTDSLDVERLLQVNVDFSHPVDHLQPLRRQLAARTSTLGIHCIVGLRLTIHVRVEHIPSLAIQAKKRM